MRRIPLIRPAVDERVKRSVLDVLESGHLTEGPVTAKLERAFSEYTGARHAIAVTSCTTGLEIALRALGVGPGDEVVVPDYTYPATASAVAAVGAMPVIVDVDPRTMNIYYDALEAAVTERTKAAVPVSLFGNPLDWDRLAEIKTGSGISIIEDAACALGSAHKGRMTGSPADISVFSMHPRKFVTTGEGGMITTDSEDLAEWMRSYKHFGLSGNGARRGACFERMGANAKLSDVLAAIGLAQMQRVDELLQERRALAARYRELLKDADGIELPVTTPGGMHSYQTFSVLVDGRDELMAAMREQGIEAQIGTYALHMQPAFQDHSICRIEGDMSGSKRSFERCLALPLYHGMTQEEQELVAETLLGLMRNRRATCAA
jgi:dTDP-4-amino-4,6-dideoxygalactose transaminase